MLRSDLHINNTLNKKNFSRVFLLLSSGFFPAFILFFLSSGIWQPTDQEIITEFILLLVIHNIVLTVAKMGLDNVNFAKSRKDQNIYFYSDKTSNLKSFLLIALSYLAFFLSKGQFNFITFSLITIASFLDCLAIIKVGGLNGRMAIRQAAISTISSYGSFFFILLFFSLNNSQVSLLDLIIFFLVGNIIKFYFSTSFTISINSENKIIKSENISKNSTKLIIQQTLNHIIYKFDQLILIFFSLSLSSYGVNRFIFFAKMNEILVGITIAMTPLIYNSVSKTTSSLLKSIFLILSLTTFSFLFIETSKYFTNFELSFFYTLLFSFLPGLSLVVNVLNTNFLGQDRVTDLLKIQITILFFAIPFFLFFMSSINDQTIFLIAPLLIFFYNLFFSILRAYK
tara:strand:- start:82 stop:1275 length:1194 start_codon:yes stop_codon:yes gene_type:complete